MAQTPEFTEYTSHPPGSSRSLDNALFLERLDTLMQKSFNDIKAFAERESRPYDETKRCVAEWHAKTLFSVGAGGCDGVSMTPEEKRTRVRNILIETSKVLESLSAVTGVQSFMLAVDPYDPQDAGFLGGSLIGREHFRGIRGGGTAGAISFKAYAQKRLSMQQEEVMTQDTSTHSSPAPPTMRSARLAKVELYDSIRSQLRKISGIRKAEMKWSNPERLSLYGVRLVGWPSDIPQANPSSLRANQNQRLLELVKHGELKFEKTMITGQEAPEEATTADAAAKEFSWAYGVGGGQDASKESTTKDTPMGISSDHQDSANDPLLSATADVGFDREKDNLESEFAWEEEEDDGHGVLDSQHDVPLLHEYNFDIDAWNEEVKPEDLEEDNSPIERRGRKRARSSESR